MKILFVQPPFSNNESLYDLTRYPPMGFQFIAAYLQEKNDNLDIAIYDSNVQDDYSVSNTVKHILEAKPDVLGMTAMTININPAMEILREVKKVRPEIVTIVGGIHCTVLPEEVLRQDFVDFIVVGEGEITTDELIKNLNSPQNYKNINGLGYKERNEIKINPNRELIKNLDELPIPSYHLLELEKYHSPYTLRKPFISMMRSRGCPYRCIFCGVQNMFGRSFRVQSPERTMKEIEYLIEKYGVKEISFKDSEFTINLDNLKRLCDLLIAKKYDLVWSSNARANRTDIELYRKMKKAGCHTVTFGAESGDQRILDIYQKDITLDQTRRAVKAAKKAGLRTNCGFIIGGPFETKESMERTIKFACEINPDYVAFGFATPFPGTKMRELAEEHGWMLGVETTHTTYTDLTMNATNASEDELREIMRRAYRRFYLRPRYILRRLTMLNKGDLNNSVNGFLNLLRNYFLKNK